MSHEPHEHVGLTALLFVVTVAAALWWLAPLRPIFNVAWPW